MTNKNKNVTQIGLLNIENLKIPKSRAIQAIDAIIGNVFDIGVAATERPAKKIRAATDRQISTDDAIHKKALEIIGTDPEFVSRAINAEAHRLLKSQRNKENVVQMAKDFLSESSPESFDNETPKVSSDWLDQFADYAGKCSDTDMQQLFAKILAGEIRSPGKYSKSTIRTVAELSKSEAELISQYSSRILGGTIIEEALDESQNFKKDLIKMAQCGIVDDATKQLGKPIRISQAADGTMQSVLQLSNENFLILTLNIPLKTTKRIRHRKEQGEHDLVFPSILLTRQGLELVQILPEPDPNDLASHIVNFVENEVKEWKIIRAVTSSTAD